MKEVHPLHPSALRKPSGYTHGFVVRGGRTLYIAGQTAASLGEIPSDDFVDQFDRSLAAVLEVVKEAGGKPADLVTFTIFVSSIDEYLRSLQPLGERYRRRMGRHYPCMALLEIARFVNPRARVEIQAIAVLDD
ncbi:MAG TPA: RidA family protein [Planctomycetota bacterium]|jgi:enamine deaminase RidA (YjgF/YER057c/UK114 family)|nr:RidA family protein [Planctomycetota bacterium]